jgi:FlaA1/EpsC-like NDP-sugar epimerase
MSISIAPRVEHHIPYKLNGLLGRNSQYSLDICILLFAFAYSYLIRFDFSVPRDEVFRALVQLPLVVIVQFAALYILGFYRLIWRYVGLTEVKKGIAAALYTALFFLILRAILPDSLGTLRIPFSIILLDICFAFGGTLSLRVLRREMYERKRRRDGRANSLEKKAVLLIGAGRAGMLTASEIGARGDMALNIIGFVDDDLMKQGLWLNGKKVLGTTEDLSHLVKEHQIDHVVVTISAASRREFRRILELCEKIPVKVRVIPSLSELLLGRVKVSRIRDVEIEDLLGREPVKLDDESMTKLLSGKTILVTGAGGSIGSELARQVARFKPKSLLLIERAEFALFNIERELKNSLPDLKVTPLIADICDEMRMMDVFNSYRPQVVLHAAAHKHVPMMETNVSEAVKNNTLGTHLIGQLAGKHDVEVFVLISTDKAVNPTSVMGASKRMAELVIQDLNKVYGTRYVAVRFGNVIGSAGSVIPIFRDQICKGGPVTVTHPDMVRYFMTIPEASQLVLQAGAIGEGGEIFILDMGEPVCILDLAKETIRMSGLRPYEDIDIVYTGVRPGEKLFEELQTVGEKVTKTRHPKIFIGKIAGLTPEQIQNALEQLSLLAINGWDLEVRRALNKLIPESSLELNIQPENDENRQLTDMPLAVIDDQPHSYAMARANAQ